MKKVIGLFLVVVMCFMSTAALLAQDTGSDKRGKKQMDPSKRWEKMAEDLKMNEKQLAEFNKINEEFKQKMKKEFESTKEQREAMKAEREKQKATMMAMLSERDEQMKKILTDEQYKQYKEKQRPSRDHKEKGRHHKGWRGNNHR